MEECTVDVADGISLEARVYTPRGVRRGLAAIAHRAWGDGARTHRSVRVARRDAGRPCRQVLGALLRHRVRARRGDIQRARCRAQQRAEQLAAEAQGFDRCAHTADMREGLQAFLDKRKPQFNGQ